jgi:beta-lactamase class A
MKKLPGVFFLILLLSGCATATGASTARVDAIIAAHPGKTIAVAMYDSRDGTTLLRNEHVVMHAASTMKVPVMLGIFEAVTRGELRLDQPVRVRNEFVSIFDGSSYALEAREDSDPSLYDLAGSDVPLDDLVRRMIVRSSNLATNLVIELIGAPRVMALMEQLGANDIQVLRGVEDDKAYHAGMNNVTTAYDLMVIFRALADRSVISAEASEAMIEILLAQEHRRGIPAGLPTGTRVAHKTGSITRIAHDAGVILRTDGSHVVLVVLTRGFETSARAQRVIADITRAIWQTASPRAPRGESSRLPQPGPRAAPGRE